MDVELSQFKPILPDFSPWFLPAIKWVLDLIPDSILLLGKVYGIVVGLAFVLSFAFLIGIIYCVEKIKAIRKKEEEIYDAKVEPGFEAVKNGDAVMANRWKNATQHINSENPNDWKQAIIESDIILDDLLSKLGYRGESIGEKLKRVAKGDMQSLNDAWEAHKVRNQIAHEGSGFSINQHEAKNVIAMYRKVFEEFYHI